MAGWIDVPVIEITDGWTVDDIQTEDDCDDAHAVLTAICASIEARMDDLSIAGLEVSVDYKKAKAALRWKKAALAVVQNKRGRLIRAAKLEQRENGRSECPSGMSLRDWFAGQALAGIMANCDKAGANGWGGIEDLAAKMAFRAADAMLSAREGGAA